jgi:hypothetical protein
MKSKEKSSELKVQKFEYYTTIDTLIVWNWDKVNTTSDLRYLLKLNDYADLPEINFDLSETWNKIQNEIIKVQDSKILTKYQIDTKELQDRRANYITLYSAIMVLWRKQDEGTIEIVKKYFPNFTYTLEGMQDLSRQLQGMAKMIDIKFGEYELKYKKSEEKQPDIYETLEKFGTYKGRDLNPFQLTVRQYLAIAKGFKEWVERNNKVNTLPKNGRR